MKKAIVFDLDGTLVNSLDDLADCCNFALKKHGFPTHETKKYAYFVGNGVPKLIARALGEHATEENMACVKAEFDTYYAEHSCDKTAPYDGILAMLDKLKNRGVKAFICSNKSQEFVGFIVEKLLGKAYFEAFVGKQENMPLKPAPDAVLKLLSDAALAPEDCLYVGDSGVDMQTGRNAGITAIGVTWGFRTEEELCENGADYIAHTPAEILQWL